MFNTLSNVKRPFWRMRLVAVFQGVLPDVEDFDMDKAERCLLNLSKGQSGGVRISTVRFAFKKLSSEAMHLVRQKGDAVLWKQLSSMCPAEGVAAGEN